MYETPSPRRWRTPHLGADEMQRRVTASRKALGLNSTQPTPPPTLLYQLHHSEAVGKTGSANFGAVLTRIKELMDRGVIDYFGLCNVSITTIEAARAFVPVSYVQNVLSLYDRSSIQAHDSSLAPSNQRGVLEYCNAHGIAFIAYGVLGGVQARDGRRNVRKDYPLLTQIAKNTTPAQFQAEQVRTGGCMHTGTASASDNTSDNASDNASGLTPEAVLLGWARRKSPNLLVITGHRSAHTLRNTQTQAAAAVCLSASDIGRIDGAKKGK